MEVLKSKKSSHSDAYAFITEDATVKSDSRKRTYKHCYSPKPAQGAAPSMKPSSRLQASKRYDFFSSDDEQELSSTPTKNSNEKSVVDETGSDGQTNSKVDVVSIQSPTVSAAKPNKILARFQCLTCNKSLRDKFSLKLHTMEEHGYAYCECSLSRVSCSGLCRESEAKVAKALRGKREKENAKCPQCGEELASKQALLVHLKGHVKQQPITSPDGRQYGQSYQLTLDSKYCKDRARAVKNIIYGGCKMKKQFMVSCNTCGFQPNILDKREIFLHNHDPYPAIYTCSKCGEKEIAPELITNHTAQHKPDQVST